MNQTFNVGVSKSSERGVEDEDDLILDGPDISRNLARQIRSCQSVTGLLQYLLEHKPAELRCGREHYLDLRELDDYMSGLCLKLKIHGYEDRGDRLKYLYSILSSKFKERKDLLKSVTKLLIDTSQRPTSVTNLLLSSVNYSSEPDEESSMDEDSERQKYLLKLILSEHEADEIPQSKISYSSDSELSEWSADEEKDSDEISNNDIPPVRKVRHSSSFGEFSDVIQPKPDAEALKKEVNLYWTQERLKAESNLQQGIRKFDAVALTSQPVISSLLVLQSRFGEFWEWKKCTKQKSELHVVFEEDVVREILWQFIITNSHSSPLFTRAWLVRPNLMVATLSKSSFALSVNKYGSTFSKLLNLRHFAKTVQQLSIKECEDKSIPPSKVFRNYVDGIQEISRYVTSHISKIERELKRKHRSINEKSEPACTTLIQLDKQTRIILDIVDSLHDVHSKSVDYPESGRQSRRWFDSIRLISCLETHLLLQTKPALYGVMMFLFTKCLYALLDEIVSSLKHLKWNENDSLFVRDNGVRLNDSSFWSECIKVRTYQQDLQSVGIIPLVCLEKLLPKVLNILKTCEVLDQLEEDYMKILGKSNIDVSDVIQEFLVECLSATDMKKVCVESATKSKHKEESIDFAKHFSYIGLGNSFVADSFRFLTSRASQKAIGLNRKVNFDDFVRLTSIPIVAHTVTLDKVLSKWFNPFSITAKDNIQKIFQDYRVIESMTVFQEVILAVREDFARAVIDIASSRNRSDEYKYEDNLNRNPRFQKLLNECYPEGRESFTVDLKLDSSTDMNCTFIVTPHFPLNLIVTPQSVAGYLFIGRQLHRIRKSLWDVSSLSLKDCKSSEGVDVTRLLMFRFCLINFCSSIRSFFTLKLFSKDFSEFAKSASFEEDLDSIRRVHEDYLESIETRMLRNPVIDTVLIRKIRVMSEVLRKKWSTGVPQPTMLMLEDTLKKCWHVVNDFQSTKYSFDFNELSFHFGRPPTCL